MRRIAPLVLASSLLVAACGGDDTSSVAATAVEPTVLTAGEATTAATSVPETSVPETSVPETSEETASTAEGSPASTADAGGPLATPLELDPCLVGEWTVSLETISQLIAAAILPVPDLAVPRGGFSVVLGDDGSVQGDADFTGAFTLGETPAEADVRWAGSGRWYTADGSVTLSLDEQEGGLVEVRLGGEVQPGSRLDADIPLAGGPYTCTEGRLEVTGTAGATTIPLVFER